MAKCCGLLLYHFSQTTFVGCDQREDLRIKGIPFPVFCAQIEDLLIFFCFFTENALVYLICINSVFCISHINIIAQCIRKLPAVIFLLKKRSQKIAITFVDILGSTTGFAVDKVNDDIQNHLSQTLCRVAFYQKHRQIQESTKIKNCDLGSTVTDAPDINVGNILRLDAV